MTRERAWPQAAAGLSFLKELWQPGPDAAEYLYGRFYRPSPRIELGQSLLDTATAAIDISDGLLQDAGHIAAASGVCLELISAAVPLSEALASGDSKKTLQLALSGGDDYELCFTLASGARAPSGCTRIGTVIDGEGVKIDLPVDFPTGYQHF